MQIKSFRDLRVWQESMNFVEEVYKISQQFPKHEVYGLAGQVRRAAVSVPANIAEGHTREHTKEYLNHISIAQASLAEAQTELEIALRLKYVEPEAMAAIQHQAETLTRQLYALRNALTNRL